jgi:two-component system CheB/CheR fusion protein
MGVLFLGSSESLGELASLFVSLDSKWKIFQYKGGSQLFTIQNYKSYNIPPNSEMIKKTTRLQDVITSNELSSELQESIIHLHLPAAIIINEDLDIFQIFNDVNKYLKIPAGKIKLNILDMARPEISAILSAAIHSAIKMNTKISYPNLKLNSDGNSEQFNLIIEPIELKKFSSRFFLILFEPNIEEHIASADNLVNLDSTFNREMVDLEQELKETRENLKIAQDEFDVTTQEANAMNEELVAANEELQSTNEELQSTNEELQSVNEELRSMNTEYQEKVDELTLLNNDMNNLVVNTGVGIIFLDKNLKIRKFSPLMYNEINLITSDIGRPISDIAFNFKYDDFYQDITEVNQTLVGKEIEAQSKFDNWYLIRIYPYKSSLNNFNGIVIIFVNINDWKNAAIQLEKLNQSDSNREKGYN